MLLNEGLSLLMSEEDIAIQSNKDEQTSSSNIDEEQVEMDTLQENKNEQSGVDEMNPLKSNKDEPKAGTGMDEMSSQGDRVQSFDGSGSGIVTNSGSGFVTNFIPPFNFGSFIDMGKTGDLSNLSNFGMVKTEDNKGFKTGIGYTLPFPDYSFDDDYMKKEEKILRPKKRRRNGEVKVIEPEDIEGDSLTKHKDSLIFMDSISFDKFIQKLSKKKNFTSEEKELIKDLRRKIKNRESARKSRMNKKSKVEDLEKKVKKLHDSTTYLSEYVAVLKNENKQLKEEIVYLMNLIQRNPIFSSLFQEYLLNPQNEEFFSTLNSQSLFLMALLYSLGLMTNVESYPDTISQLKAIYNERLNCRNEYIKESENYNYKSEEDSGSSIEAF